MYEPNRMEWRPSPPHRRCTTLELEDGAYLTLPVDVLLEVEVARPVLIACGISPDELPRESGEWVLRIADWLDDEQDRP